MKSLVLSMMFFCLTGFGGCASTNPQTVVEAQKAVFTLKAGYAAALKVAVAYKRLPTCGSEGALTLCAKPEVVAKLQKADDLAAAAINHAEAAVRAPEFAASNIQAVLVSAKESVRAFSDITSTLAVK